MASKRSLEDRLLRRIVPRPVDGYAPPPVECGPGLWTLERRFRHFRLALLPSRTSIVRLASGGLLVISPPPIADEPTRAALDRLGAVEQVVVPNPFHYLFASEFMAHYPGASLLAAPGVKARAPEVPVAEEIGPRAPEAWSGVLESVVLGPAGGTCEVLFFHVPTRTLILTDVAFHMTTYPRAIDRLVWRLSGIPGAFGPGRTSRAMLLRDREAAAHAFARVLEWPFERIVVAHGEMVTDDARGQFETAFRRYLPGGNLA